MLFLTCHIDLCVVPGNRFLSGLLLSITPAKAVVPPLQTVFQADTAHMNFGKYTMELQPTAMLFQLQLGLFWKFALKHHPCLNDHCITIITDQQKGIIESLQGILPKAVNFFCSFHWRQNILQYVMGGKSDYSCHWFYNLLVGCCSIAMIDCKRYDLSEFIDEKAVRYLGSIGE